MKQLQSRHIMLIAALCGMMSNCLGVLFNVAGLYFNPIAADFGIGRGDVSMAHTIASLGCAVGGITGAWAAKHMKLVPALRCITLMQSILQPLRLRLSSLKLLLFLPMLSP